MNQTISLKQALQIIEAKDEKGNPIPFDISFRTLQRNSKTGGALRTIRSAKLLVSVAKQCPTNHQLIKQLQQPNRIKKSPNHYANRTRNIQKPNGDIAKVRIRLIVSINNQKVVY